MNILLWIILFILVIVVILLIINQKFNLFGKFKELKRDQDKYKQIHEKYKDLLDK